MRRFSNPKFWPLGLAAVLLAGCGDDPPKGPPKRVAKTASAIASQQTPEQLAATSWPLVDRVPADAGLYVGWRGARRDKRLAAWMQGKPLDRLGLGDVLPQFLKRLHGDSAQKIKQRHAVIEIFQLMWRHPWVFWMREHDGRMQWTLEVDAADDAGRLSSLLSQWHAPWIAWIDYDQQTLRLSFDRKHVSLKGKPTYADRLDLMAITGLFKEGVDGVVYVDVPAMRPVVHRWLVNQKALLPGWERLLGTDGLKSWTHVVGFESRGWMEMTRWGVPQDRRGGLIYATSRQPLDIRQLKHVPAAATSVQVHGLDVGQVLDGLRQVVVENGWVASADLQQALAYVDELFFFDLKKDWLAHMGSQWVGFVHPQVGQGQHTVWLNTPKDADKLAKTLKRWAHDLNAIAGILVADGKRTVPVTLQPQTHGRLEIQVLEIENQPRFAWVFAEGQWVLGPNPSVLVDAVAQLRRGGGWDRSPGWENLNALPPGQTLTGLGYRDLSGMQIDPLQDFLEANAQLSRMGLSPLALDAPLKPISLKGVQPNLTVTVSDDRAITSWKRSDGPIQAWLDAGHPMLEGTHLVADGIRLALPALKRARHTANRSLSAAHMSFLIGAMHAYSLDHDDAFPPDLGTLVQEELVKTKNCLHPGFGKVVPFNLKGESLARWVNQNSDYVYRPGQNANLPDDAILLYERFTPEVEGLNIGYGDGTVEWLPLDKALKELHRVGEPLPGWAQRRLKV